MGKRKLLSESDARFLSSELWQLIVSRVGDGDLKAVSLVCKDFFEYSNPLKKSLKVVHPNISVLSRHLSRFTRLKAIDLSDFEGDINEAIPEIEGSGISLESLNISIDELYQGWWREILRLVRGLAPNLKALNCNFKMPLDENALLVIANTFPSLEQLRIHAPNLDSDPPSDLEFESLASKLKPLEKIRLYECNVCDQFIIALSLNCVLLKDVAIRGNHYVTEMGIGHLLRNRPNLEALHFDVPEPEYSSSIINVENSISHAKSLTSLKLDNMSDTDKVLKAIAKAKLVRLSNLSLYFCGGLTTSGLLEVLSNHRLTKLRLPGANFTDEDIKLLVLNGKVSNLTHFNISGGKVTSSTLLLLSTRCPSLVDIEIELFELVQLDLFPLFKNHKIRSLHLHLNQHGSSDEFLKRLGCLFPKLKCLHLSNNYSRSEVTRIGIESILKSCKQITELKLWGYNKATIFEANDPGFVELNLEVLNLSFSRIDDGGLAAIAKKCPRLLSLDLSQCMNITTKGIKRVVQNVKTLTSLNLMYCDHLQNYGALLEWMLSTRSLASLHKIFLHKKNFTKEQRDKFLHHGCMLSSV